MDDESFDRGIKILCATYQGLKVDDEKLELYRILLSDLNGEIFLAAVVKITRTVKDLYPGSNLIAIIHEQCNSLVEPSLMAEEAWLEVSSSKMPSNGLPGEPPDFGNEVINNSVRVVGWKNIYFSTFSDYDSGKYQRLRDMFIRTFKSYQNNIANNNHTKSAVKLLGGSQEWLE